MTVLPKKELCLRCKGRGYCNLDFCPAYTRLNSLVRIQKTVDKENFATSAPGVFVGRFGYPHLNVGVLSPPEIREDAWVYEAPRFWSSENYNIPQVIELRQSIINSHFRIGVRDRSHFLDLASEVSMASKPVDVEIALSKKPHFSIKFEPYVAPIGANALLKNIELTENPRINSQVDKVVSDMDLKASQAILKLAKRNFDESFLARNLSVGNLGVKFERKLVPTRWSITAVDDVIGKELTDEVKQCEKMGYAAYFGGYVGNYFLILCFPEPWAYELFETYAGQTGEQSEQHEFTTDYESYAGRKSYAENCAGGYYAARHSILEKLAEMKKQASVLVLRFITGEYWAPLGVWVVRETVRKAMAAEPLEFESKELLLKYAESLAKKKFNYPASILLKESKLLRQLKSQTKLNAFV